MSRNLSFNTRKSLCNQLGEAAGNEIADLVQQLIRRVELLERTKVDVTPIVPGFLANAGDERVVEPRQA